MELRKRLRKINDEVLESAADPHTEFIRAEAFDQRCLEICERLHLDFPDVHHLTIKPPLATVVSKASGDKNISKKDKTTASPENFFEKPKLAAFDGRSDSWPLWKSVFEKNLESSRTASRNENFPSCIKSQEGHICLQARDQLHWTQGGFRSPAKGLERLLWIRKGLANVSYACSPRSQGKNTRSKTLAILR